MELIIALEYQRALRRERVYRDPLDVLHLGDEELIKKYRFPRQDIVDMIQEFEPLLKRNTFRSHAIPVSTQILVALRFYASGSFQNVIADSSGLSQQSVSKIITLVSNILEEKARNEIKMPAGVLQLHQTMRDFHAVAGFPRIIGAIDGTHVPIKAPTDDEAIFVNRKKFHSLNIQVVCDAHRMIINYVVKFPGSTHDAYIWNNSTLRTRFQRGEFRDAILLGDSGYPLEPFLMTPFANPVLRGEEEFNRCHTRTRVIIEQTFGVLKSRFRCLHKSGGNLQYEPLKCSKIIAACLLLHNRCIKRNIPNPVDEHAGGPMELQHQDQDEVHHAQDQGQPPRGLGRQIRTALVENFFQG